MSEFQTENRSSDLDADGVLSASKSAFHSVARPDLIPAFPTLLLRAFNVSEWAIKNPRADQNEPSPTQLELMRSAVLEPIHVLADADWDELEDAGQPWLAIGSAGVGMVADLACRGEPYMTIAEAIDCLKPGRYPVYSVSDGQIVEWFDVPELPILNGSTQ